VKEPWRNCSLDGKPRPPTQQCVRDGLDGHRANRVQENGEPFERTCCPLRTSWLEDIHISTPERAGCLLAWLAALLFCSGLLSLAVLAPLGVIVPRGLIVVCGAGCAVLTLLCLLLRRPWQQGPPLARQEHPVPTDMGQDADLRRDGARCSGHSAHDARQPP
jgi:hypothetical protein